MLRWPLDHCTTPTTRRNCDSSQLFALKCDICLKPLPLCGMNAPCVNSNLRLINPLMADDTMMHHFRTQTRIFKKRLPTITQACTLHLSHLSSPGQRQVGFFISDLIGCRQWCRFIRLIGGNTSLLPHQPVDLHCDRRFPSWSHLERKAGAAFFCFADAASPKSRLAWPSAHDVSSCGRSHFVFPPSSHKSLSPKRKVREFREN